MFTLMLCTWSVLCVLCLVFPMCCVCSFCVFVWIVYVVVDLYVWVWRVYLCDVVRLCIVCVSCGMCIVCDVCFVYVTCVCVRHVFFLCVLCCVCGLWMMFKCCVYWMCVVFGVYFGFEVCFVYCVCIACGIYIEYGMHVLCMLCVWRVWVASNLATCISHSSCTRGFFLFVSLLIFHKHSIHTFISLIFILIEIHFSFFFLIVTHHLSQAKAYSLLEVPFDLISPLSSTPLTCTSLTLRVCCLVMLFYSR